MKNLINLLIVIVIISTTVAIFDFDRDKEKALVVSNMLNGKASNTTQISNPNNNDDGDVDTDSSLGVVTDLVKESTASNSKPNLLPGSKGYGVNLLKLAEVSDKYIKDLLELYIESENGGVNDSKYHLSLGFLLGIHLIESGTHPDSNVGLIPWSPFKLSQYNKPASNFTAEQVVLKGFGKKVGEALGVNWKVTGEGDYAWFQMRLGKYSDRTPSVHTPAGGRESSGPTVFYLPDQVSILNHQFSDTVDKYGVSSDLSAAEALMGMVHNRGSIDQAAYGINYSSKGSEGRLVGSNMTDALDGFKEVLSSYSKYSHVKYDHLDGYRMKLYGTFMLIDDGWKVNSYTADYLAKIDKAVDVWNEISSNKVNSVAELKQQINKNVANLATELGYSPTDTERIYGTAGNYTERQGFGTKYGYVFKILNKTSSAYKQKIRDTDPKHVIAFDTLPTAHMISSTVGMGFVGRLMQLGGANVDPTDPKTYMGKFEGSDTFLPKDPTDSEVEFKELLSLLGYRLPDDSFSLDPSIYAILLEGYKQTPSYYSQGRQLEVNTSNYSAIKEFYPSTISQLYKYKGKTEYYSGVGELKFPLKYANTRALDCSGLISYASYFGSGKKYVWMQSPGTGESSLADTDLIMSDATNTSFIIEKDTMTQSEIYSKMKDKLKPGDIFVKDKTSGLGHTYFHLGFAPDDIVIRESISRSEKELRVSRGTPLCLEASDKVNGVHIPYIDGTKYAVKRLQ